MKKIEYACAAAGIFIKHLHTENFDRGMIATFGNSFQVVQNFTSTENYLHSALRTTARSVSDEGTRLYDSIEDGINTFWQYGDRRRPWILVVVTDGKDYYNSGKYHNNPAGIGRYIAQRFNHEPSNFMFLLGVGKQKDIDIDALATIGAHGGILAVPVEAFPLLEAAFLAIAVSITTDIVGQRITNGNVTWEQVAQLRRVSQRPLDYAFLIDRSGSMSERGD